MTPEDERDHPDDDLGPPGSASAVYMERSLDRDSDEFGRHLDLLHDWRPDYAYSTVAFVTTAAAFGVIGNVTHQLVMNSLKQLFRRLRSIDKDSELGLPEFNKIVDAYAVAALLARMKEQQLPSPREEDLKVVWSVSKKGEWPIRGTVTSGS